MIRLELAALPLVILAAAAVSYADEVGQSERQHAPKVGMPTSNDDKAKADDIPEAATRALQRVRTHSFQPIKNGFTIDAILQKQGVADLENKDWRVRLLALRDLVRLGTPVVEFLIGHLRDPNEHVRQVCAMTLGLLQAQPSVQGLRDVLSNDEDMVVRSSAAVSLGEIGDQDSLSLLKDRSKMDPSRDVRHQCEIAAYRIENNAPRTNDAVDALIALDESSFRQLEVGKPALDIELFDTRGREWRLADHQGKSVVLIWIFADWCPVCHGEFHELIELREQFARQNIELVTIECHDLFRARVMVGDEISPQYWFSKKSPQESYRDKIWWRHLSDPAGAVGAKYGVDPMAFVVHSEWINRPSTIIIDPEGIVRFAYYGTYWGDRPSIAQTLELISSGRYEFRHPKRLEIDR